MSQHPPDPWWPADPQPAGPVAPAGVQPPGMPPAMPTHPSLPPHPSSALPDPDLPAYAPPGAPGQPAPPGWGQTQAPPWRDPFFYGTADRPLPPPWRVAPPPEPSSLESAWAETAETLRQPLTGAAVGGMALVAVVLPALAAVVTLSATHNDWAAGVQVASGVLLLEGLLLLAFGITRRRIGYPSARALLACVVGALVLGLPGAAGLPLAPALHLTQAQQAEAHGDWVTAVREYELAGRQPPTSQDLARIYNEWGEQLLREGYPDFAAGEFNTVLTVYPQSGPQFSRALSQVPAAYGAWIAHATTDVSLGEIVANLDVYRTASWCATACAPTMRDLEAQARFAYGTRLASEQQYQQAIAQFEAITGTLTGSAYVARAHASAATAYLAVGQSQRAGERCQDAIPTYQTLAAHYGDTSAGRQAQAALGAPVEVTGVVVYYDSDQPPTMWLSRHAYTGGGYSHDLSTPVRDNGVFDFKQVPPGQYMLTAADPTTGEMPFIGSSMVGSGTTQAITVQPLCPLNVGTGYLM